VSEFATGTVNVPAVGKVKKRYVVIPVGLAAAYIGFRWYQARQEPAEAPAGSDGLYSSDDLSEYGLSTTGGSTNVTGNTGNTSTDATNPNAIDSNAEWTQKAVELLGNAGYDGTTVYAALGEFLARRALDKTEASIARAALAAVGQPPVNGPYSVVEEAGTNTGTLAAPTNLKAGGTATATSVPLQWDKVDGALYYRIYRGTGENIGSSADTKFTATGLQADTAYPFSVAAVGTTGKVGGRSSVVTLRTARVKLSKPSGLKASAITKSSFRVTCGKVNGAQYYRWYVNGRASGASDAPYRDFTGLKPNTTYSVTVAADTSNQEPGPQSSALRVKTKR
jgi:hypothetical protein